MTSVGESVKEQKGRDVRFIGEILVEQGIITIPTACAPELKERLSRKDGYCRTWGQIIGD